MRRIAELLAVAVFTALTMAWATTSAQPGDGYFKSLYVEDWADAGVELAFSDTAAVCPAGWEVAADMRGRFQAGVTTNGTVGAVRGSAISNTNSAARRGGTAQTLNLSTTAQVPSASASAQVPSASASARVAAQNVSVPSASGTGTAAAANATVTMPASNSSQVTLGGGSAVGTVASAAIRFTVPGGSITASFRGTAKRPTQQRHRHSFTDFNMRTSGITGLRTGVTLYTSFIQSNTEYVTPTIDLYTPEGTVTGTFPARIVNITVPSRPVNLTTGTLQFTVPLPQRTGTAAVPSRSVTITVPSRSVSIPQQTINFTVPSRTVNFTVPSRSAPVSASLFVNNQPEPAPYAARLFCRYET